MSRTPATSPTEASREEKSPAPRKAAAPSAMALGMADAALVALFLGLTFLLGVFPLNDTDFWWHLRTGDLIRQTGRVPRTDWYTFGAEGHAWIDLHWGFQVALSWLYSLGGVDATNVAKCVVTTLAVAILLAARRRDWPLWVMVLAWLPALLLLGGRMYVRPETVTLLYLAIDLAVLLRIDRSPRLAWILPAVQVLWVNTQGLFALGPIIIGMALIDAALRRGAFSRERRGWWRIVLAAALATGLACLVNPYGIFGAIFPLQLVGTMSNPVFKRIMELQPILDFVREAGLDSLPLQLHFVTLILGALSFLIPLTWRAITRVSDGRDAESARGKKKRKKSVPAEPPWRLSPFRLMLYAAFSYLSFQATRNSHQFAAVVGTVTAWNFAEWAAAIAKRRAERTARAAEPGLALAPRLGASVAVAVAIALVGSGRFYAWANEGRLVGWGEKPLWFPHDAAKFAGSAGMPGRFLVFHNGHAGLFEYYNGPERKVFADARLEVMGPEVFGDDKDLGQRIASNQDGWTERVAGLEPGVPGALVDHVQAASADIASSYLGNPNWRCVWYDPVASVYLHRGATRPAEAVDFAGRHFGREPAAEPRGAEALSASARALMLHAMSLAKKRLRPDLAASLILLGQGHARRALALDPESAPAWKSLGLLEVLRDLSSSAEPIPRFKKPFDPLFDLANVRATHDLLEASRLAPDDFMTLLYLFKIYASREMYEAAAPIADRLLGAATTREQEKFVAGLAPEFGRVKATAMRPPRTAYNNLGELERNVNALLNDGHAKAAADLLEGAYAPSRRTWDQADRIATIRLHLGRPDLARELWQGAADAPRPAVRDARIAATHLIQGDFDSARKFYAAAIAAEPNSFEANYGLAVLERDAGRADEALAAALSAEKAAASDVARSAAQEIAEFVRPYSRKAAAISR